jgi:hypothetical protein
VGRQAAPAFDFAPPIPPQCSSTLIVRADSGYAISLRDVQPEQDRELTEGERDLLESVRGANELLGGALDELPAIFGGAAHRLLTMQTREAGFRGVDYQRGQLEDFSHFSIFLEHDVVDQLGALACRHP